MSTNKTAHKRPTLTPTGPDSANDDGDPTELEDPTNGIHKPLVIIGCGSQKRDPTDPADLQKAVPEDCHIFRTASGSSEATDDTGPAWRARDLYTSTYFVSKRRFAEALTAWTDEAPGWGILSAEHGFLWPFEPVEPYDTGIEDLGDDPTDPSHRVTNEFQLRCPDGQPVVTERDLWARSVAVGIASFISSHRENGANPGQCDADSLIILAGQRYLSPLRSRGVFEYGISRLGSSPNRGHKLPIDSLFLFEKISATGIGGQMSWLQTATDRAGGVPQDTQQREMNAYTESPERYCQRCGVKAQRASLNYVAGEVVCENCEPSRCARCDEFTHDSGTGGFPLCAGCQTDIGNRMIQSDAEPDTHTQLLLDRFSN